jgi:hypothetical protein
MNKTYGRINWENYPSDETPLNESNLNKIDVATDEIDNRVITLDTTKATKEEVSTLVQDVTFEEKTGIITITKKNGSKITIDTQMEKIAVNFSYNAETQQVILTLIDGTRQYIDLSALITQYEFLDSDTVAFSIDSAGKVSAIVKEASIQEKHLQPNYLADIKVEAAKAQASQSAAAKSESNAKASETAAAASESNAAASATKAQSYATGGTNSRTGEDTDNAKYYSQQSAQSQSAAATSADTASTKAKEAAASAATAKTSADNAAGSANLANEKANSAANSATIAVSNSNAAQQYASNAAASADTAQNYAVADTDSAKYYYEQARRISESFSGALRPMGTVAFANLPALSATTSGNMYNISDQFVTTSDFKEGAGNVIPAGANVYKTEDGKWDVLAGTPVTGVKGSAESAYRRGNVNITAENVGAVPLGGNVGSADRAARLGRNGNADYPMTFNWAGKDGQPSWLWGGENGEDMYVYNPSNFSVNYAASAGNVNWNGVTDKPSTYPPEAHNHNTLDSDFGCTLPDNTTATYTALNSNGYTTGYFLKTIRGQYTAPSWFENNYASGIAFGGADTHAVISCRYEFPRVTFCGGNGTEPNWWYRLQGTSGHNYMLDDFITTSGTDRLAGSIIPNEDVAMDLGDSTHRFTNVYSSNITTGAIYMEHDSNAIYESGNDAANGNGGGLNNLVIRSWWGVSFTSPVAAGRYGGKNQTAVGIDCREGIVKAYNFEGLVNGHSVNADVPSDAKFTDTKGTCLSGRSSAYGWSVNRLASGYLIEAFHTAAQNYTMTNQYGNMYWASFEITIPQSNNIKFFDAINITPFATSGLISVSITNYTTSKIQGFVFSPLAETKSISFHVTLHGTAS